jgi:hypothetical protein
MPPAGSTWRTGGRCTHGPPSDAIASFGWTKPAHQCWARATPPCRGVLGASTARTLKRSAKGGATHCMCCEPLRGWRPVRVTPRRTTRDWAACSRALVDVDDPAATRMRVVLDTLHPHTGASWSEACPPDEARRLRDRVALHHPPKHASWLHMAASASGVLQSQGLHRRLDSAAWWSSEIRAGAERRHKPQGKIHWSFPIAVARHPLKKLYPVIAHSKRPT